MKVVSIDGEMLTKFAKNMLTELLNDRNEPEEVCIYVVRKHICLMTGNDLATDLLSFNE